MGKTRFHVYAALVFALFSSIILPISLASCNGNGGGSDYESPTYDPGPSPGRSHVDASETLDLSNAGDMEGIIARL
ncbi:MAG: hypothetical protein IJL80_04045, partial [Treponema sp.]|nr:hypothetical protein [Treponema sp.]